MKSIQEHMRCFRGAKALSIKDACLITECPSTSWRAWESGARYPNPRALARLCESLGIDKDTVSLPSDSVSLDPPKSGSSRWWHLFVYESDSGYLRWRASHMVAKRRWGSLVGTKVAALKSDHLLYLSVHIDDTPIGVHRIIWEMHNGPIPEGMVIDHIDGDGMNNVLSNLRVATRSENSTNCRTPVNNTSGFKGVSWCRQKNKWVAYVNKNRKRYYAGSYDSPEKAREAWVRKAADLHGDFLCTNR